MSSPRVSIGMPLYNSQRYLSEAFDSLLSQDYKDVEIVVSDNASTDRTWEICQRYARADGRVRLHRNEVNMGAAHNYNRTVTLARGEMFKWAAYDDICAPTLVRRCVEALDEAGPSAVLAYPRTILIDDDGAELGLYRDGVNLRSRRPYLRVATLAGNLSLCNAVMGVIRTNALRRTGLIRPQISSDVTLLAELATLGEFCEVEEDLFFRRIHTGSSRQGSTTDLGTIALWFDTRKPGRNKRPKAHIVLNATNALLRADVPTRDRLSCAVAFATVWSARNAHIRGSHAKRRLRALLSSSQDESDSRPYINRGRLGERTEET